MLPGVPNHSFIVRFRPTGPWRFGPDSGARDRVDLVYHSDAVFSAVSAAMDRLGMLEAWLDATARSQDEPAVRLSSFYPFQGSHLLVIPPRSLWPPPDSTKVRYKAARFVPLSLVESMLSGLEIDEGRWLVDGESECLIPSDRNALPAGPFRMAVRSNAGVDRLEPGKSMAHSTACLEFARDAGLWTAVIFAGDAQRNRWEEPVRSALRFLADSGFGGERSRGWGRSEMPEWEPWNSAGSTAAAEGSEVGYWLLSLYTPSESDSIDWKRGSYSTISRSGRIESAARWGEAKHRTLMIAEGSVLLAAREPKGTARDVAPPGFPHPVFRSGFAVALPVPWRVAA